VYHGIFNNKHKVSFCRLSF